MDEKLIRRLQIKKAFINLKKEYSTIFGYKVKNPEEFGVAKLNDKQEIIDIVEKPKNPPSNLAIGGIYLYDERFWQFLDDCVEQNIEDLSITFRILL